MVVRPNRHTQFSDHIPILQRVQAHFIRPTISLILRVFQPTNALYFNDHDKYHRRNRIQHRRIYISGWVYDHPTRYSLPNHIQVITLTHH